MAGRPVHSALGASSAHRWMACPGSVRLSTEAGASASRSGRAAAEGTVAHEIAAECLLLGREAWEYIGETRSHDGWDFVVDREMAEGVQLYVNFVNDKLQKFAEAA